MTQYIGLRDLDINYGAAFMDVKGFRKFLPSRIEPRFCAEWNFPPTSKRKTRILSHFFQPPEGCELRDLPRIMEERLFREPSDIREVFALGAVIIEEKCKFAIYAPELTKREDAVLIIHRWPEWQGLGLTVSTINPEDEDYPSNYEFIGFSEP